MTGPRAVTLIEVLLTISVVAIAAAIIMPVFTTNDRLRVMAAADLVMSDIELAQVMSIATPDTPVVIRFESGKASYWLAYADDPDVPLARPGNGEPYLVEFGVGRARSAQGVVLSLVDMNDSTLEFDATGSVANQTKPSHIEVSLAGNKILVTIAPTTGTATQSVP